MGHDGGLLAVGKLDKKERGICVHLMVDFFWADRRRISPLTKGVGIIIIIRADSLPCL